MSLSKIFFNLFSDSESKSAVFCGKTSLLIVPSTFSREKKDFGRLERYSLFHSLVP